ncbi:MAG: hypothetical protein AABW84_01470 [Nanoarchaeota archaeon]
MTATHKPQWSIEGALEANKRRNSERAENMLRSAKLKNSDLAERTLRAIDFRDYTEAKQYCDKNNLKSNYEPFGLEKDLLTRIYPNANHRILLNDKEQNALNNLIRENYVVKGPYHYHLTPIGLVFFLGPQFTSEEASQ